MVPEVVRPGNVTLPPADNVVVADKLVNTPDPGSVAPTAGGDANRLTNPTPDTVEEADNVVNAPAAGVPLPIEGGETRREASDWFPKVPALL